ncbi:hypothetical protein GF374_01180 [Candidatus Woesearchaeota archaeon]|nr:hypothetical protein [Candidatus Woesearchaeota archaeon]
MKNMRRAILILFVISLLPTAVLAQGEFDTQHISDKVREKLSAGKQAVEEEIQLPAAGAAKDSPFYFADRAMERLRLKITKDDIKKARLHMKFAEERLSEAKKLAEQNKPELSDETIADYEKHLENAANKIEKAKKDGKDIDEITNNIKEKTSKHIEVLQRVLEKVPETAKPAIQKAIEISQERQEEIPQKLEQIKEKVMEQTQEEPEKETEEVKEENKGEKIQNKGWH